MYRVVARSQVLQPALLRLRLALIGDRLTAVGEPSLETRPSLLETRQSMGHLGEACFELLTLDRDVIRVRFPGECGGALVCEVRAPAEKVGLLGGELFDLGGSPRFRGL